LGRDERTKVASRSDAGEGGAARTNLSASGFMASDRVIRAARFAARANAIACRHGACPSASASAARRSTSRTRNARRAARPALLAAAPRRVPSPPFLTLHGIGSAFFRNATWVGWSGARNSAGPSANRAAISAGRYARSRTAAQNSRVRVASVRTSRWIARFAAPQSPCVVCAAIIRAIPSGVRGPVHFPPCILHRPFAIAGARQGLPERAIAPQRGARLGLPRG
jgi:hypothetical protein